MESDGHLSGNKTHAQMRKNLMSHSSPARPGLILAPTCAPNVGRPQLDAPQGTHAGKHQLSENLKPVK